MKILNLEQRSDEWLHFREGKISGSKAKEFGTPRTILKAEWLELAENLGVEIPLNQKGEPKNLTIQELKDIIGEAEVQKKECEVELGDAIYKLIAERIAKPLNENDYADRLDGRKYSSAVRGEILEVEAREKLAKKLNKEIIEGRVWQADFNENIICSPDGEIANQNGEITEAVEIKCLDSWKQVRAFYEQKPPVEYLPQIIQYFAVNEKLEKLHFVMYSDAFALAPQLELLVFEIHRRDLEQEIQRAIYFEESALALVEQEIAKLLF